jgi:type II secretory pathway pseudopilin PulG
MRAAAITFSVGGFSLIELLVILALLIILTVLSAGRLTTSARRRETAACQGNLEKIHLALSLYRGDNSAYPSLAAARGSEEPLSLLVPKCTTDTEIFICPGTADKPLPEGERFGGGRISYAYYMGRTGNDNPQDILLSDWQVDSAPKKMGQLVFSLDGKKPGNNHDALGGNLLSCAGAVSTSGPKAAQDLLYPPTVRLLNP